MFLPDSTYASAASFVLGYDLACEGGVCLGFREWLVMRVGRGSNLAWSGLVLDVAFPSSVDPERSLVSAEAHHHAIDVLFNLLAEFDELVRSRYDGLKEVFADYERWQKKRGID